MPLFKGSFQNTASSIGLAIVVLCGLSACKDAPAPPKAVSSTPVTLYKVQHSDETIAKFPGQVERQNTQTYLFELVESCKSCWSKRVKKSKKINLLRA